MLARGFFGVAIDHGKTVANLGTLWRSADLLGAAFMATVARRYQRQCSDTMKSWKHIPLWHFDTIDALVEAAPRECLIVGVELDDSAVPLAQFDHPERAVYLFGAEDHGLTREALRRCHKLVRLPGRRSMNVACAGTVVMYDRVTKASTT